jgi:capsular exopolysaccharide synthesis family protein
MDINSYIAPIIKWWWLPLIAAVVAGLSTLVATIGEPDVYESRTTLMVGQSINNPNPSSTTFYLEQELAKIYADMASREPIRKAVRDSLGLERLPQYVVNALPNTQLIEITVSDTSPERSQVVAAELANQLINRTPTSISPEEQDAQNFVDEQLAGLQQDIKNAENDIEELKRQLGDLRGAREISEVERQIAALEDKKRTLQKSYSDLRASSQRNMPNTLTIIEAAEVPLQPTGPNRVFNVLLAAALGACVAVGGAYLIEFLDQRVSHPKEVTRLLGWPTLAEIEQMSTDSNEANDQLHSMAAGSFRTLRANLELAGVGGAIKTLLVTSPAVSEGKSTIALNLAITLSAGARKVVLVDADLHRSKFNYPDRKGLGDLLLEGGTARDYLITPYQSQLSILPAGKNPVKAAAVLDTSHMRRILGDLNDVADVIVVDGPPTFVSDALVLAASVDRVLAVVRLGQTPREAIAQMKAHLQVPTIQVLGVVMNGISTRPSYHYSYYTQSPLVSQTTSRQLAWMKFLGRFKKITPSQWNRRTAEERKRETTA